MSGKIFKDASCNLSLRLYATFAHFFEENILDNFSFHWLKDVCKITSHSSISVLNDQLSVEYP